MGAFADIQHSQNLKVGDFHFFLSLLYPLYIHTDPKACKTICNLARESNGFSKYRSMSSARRLIFNVLSGPLLHPLFLNLV